MSTAIINPSNNTAPDTVLFQNWGPIPATTNFNYIVPNTIYVQPQTKTIIVKDVIGLPETSQYTQFRLRTNKFYVNGAVQWLATGQSAYQFNVAFTYYDILANGLSFPITMATTNLSSLTPGTYEARLILQIEGKTSSGNWLNVSGYIHTVKLNVYPVNTVTFSPSTLNITHYQNTPSPVAQIAVNGPQWILRAKRKYILSSDNPDVEISTIVDAYGETLYTATGSGNKSVGVSLSNFFNTAAAVGSSDLTSSVVMWSISTLIGQIYININLENEGTFVATPDHLEFSGIKGIQEPLEKFVLIFCISDYTMTLPPWMTVVDGFDESGETSLPGKIFCPIPTANMETGTYTGNIILSAVINGIPSELVIPVTYVLDGFLTLPYNANDFNFTLDKKFIDFNTEFENTYFELAVSGVASDFYNFQEKAFDINLKIPIYNHAQKYNVGLGIHRLMKRVKELQENSNYQYRPAKVKFTFKELDNDTGVILRDAVSPEFLFVAGHSPVIIQNFAILSSNYEPTRVTTSGYQYLNILMPAGTADIKIFKNGELHIEYTIFSNENIYCDTILFGDFKQGDVIEYRVQISEETFLSKKFLIFPEGERNNMIIWEDKFLLKSNFQFTGKSSIKVDLESKTFTSFAELVEIVKILDSTQIPKLTINTGYISKKDIATVDALLDSKRAWLVLGENKFIDLVPTVKTYIPHDSDTALVMYDIEFQINRKYNEEIYNI